MPRPLAMVAAFTVGLLSVVQSRINGALGELLEDGLFAAWLSFTVGLLVVGVIVLAVPNQRATLAKVRSALQPDSTGHRQLRSWQLLGGLGGATFVAAQGATVQFLGVAIFTVAVVAGQNANSLVVDRLGLGPAGMQAFTWRRAIAALIATAGVAVAVSGRVSGTSFAVGALVFAFVAGALIAVQQAINGRVAASAGSPWTAGLANFTAGWLGLTLAVLIEHVLSGRGLTLPPSPLTHPVVWIGGLIGVAFIVVAASVVRTLGVLLFALLSIAGQVTGALVVELLYPAVNKPFSWTLVIGVLITGGAVALAAVGRAQVAGHNSHRDRDDS